MVVLPLIIIYRKAFAKFEPRIVRKLRVTVLDLGTIKIFMTTYQLIGSMAWTLDVTFPSPFNEFLGFLTM